MSDMKMPNSERAIVAIEKLVNYCLNPYHPHGRHKARVFASALGIGMEQAEWLQIKLLEAARTHEAKRIETGDFGERYVIRFLLEGPGGQAIVRSLWLIKHSEDFPRLSSCYVE